jgi:hypothetical protein
MRNCTLVAASLVAGLTACSTDVISAQAADALSPSPAWMQLSPITNPPARFGGSTAYDSATGQYVLFGGGGAIGDSEVDFNDTWVWSGSTWGQVDDSTDPGCINTCVDSPSAREGAEMAYDASTGQLVLFGGAQFNGNFTYFNETWIWNGTTWTEIAPTTSPPARFYGSMAYDSDTGQAVLFGGDNDGNLYNDTWTWNGSTWTQVDDDTDPGCTTSCSDSPLGRYYLSMSYDDATSQLLVFGGDGRIGNSGVTFDDSWVWNGSTWGQVDDSTDPGCTTSCTGSPLARYAASMAYDPDVNQLLLFGGGGDSVAYFNDTWTWDGSVWSQVDDSTDPDCTATCTDSPPARAWGMLTFDQGTSQPVLFGGYGNNYWLNDTWGVGAEAQTITFTSAIPADATLAGPAYLVSANASSGLSVTLTIDESASSVCSISGSTVSFVGLGTCTIDANQAGNTDYSAAAQVQQTFNVGPAIQSISFTSPAPSDAVGGPSYMISATGGTSGNPVILSVDSSAQFVCGLSGSVVTFIGAGTCTIDANQAGNADYAPAPQVQQSFSVSPPSKCVFTSPAKASGSAGQAFTFVVLTNVCSPWPAITGTGLPLWLTLTDYHDGYATLMATDPLKGKYHFTLTATNSAGTVKQKFVLTVKPPKH